MLRFLKTIVCYLIGEGYVNIQYVPKETAKQDHLNGVGDMPVMSKALGIFC